MTTPINLPLYDRLAEPPLVDALHYEVEADGFAVTFIPSEGADPTHAVFIPRDSAAGRQVSAYVYRIQQLISNRLDRVVHGGGGDYSLRLATGEMLRLSDETATHSWAPEVFDHLKQIAEVAEGAFSLHQVAKAP